MKNLLDLAPAISAKTESYGLSNRYSFLPTTHVIQDMSRHGWFPVDAKQRKSKYNDLHGKHIVIFENIDHSCLDSNDKVTPRIILQNSHDGTSSLRFHIGMFRLVCSNGLVVRDGYGESFKIRHMNYSMDELTNKIELLSNNFDNIYSQMNNFSKRILTDEEKLSYALEAALLRYPDCLDTIYNNNGELGEIDYEMLLKPKRGADQGDDLWRTFNVVQERLLSGEFAKVAMKKNNLVWQKARSIKAIDKNIKLNQDLWGLTEKYAFPELLVLN
jgi:hypothetical protein